MVKLSEQLAGLRETRTQRVLQKQKEQQQYIPQQYEEQPKQETELEKIDRLIAKSKLKIEEYRKKKTEAKNDYQEEKYEKKLDEEDEYLSSLESKRDLVASGQASAEAVFSYSKKKAEYKVSQKEAQKEVQTTKLGKQVTIKSEGKVTGYVYTDQYGKKFITDTKGNLVGVEAPSTPFGIDFQSRSPTPTDVFEYKSIKKAEKEAEKYNIIGPQHPFLQGQTGMNKVKSNIAQLLNKLELIEAGKGGPSIVRGGRNVITGIEEMYEYKDVGKAKRVETFFEPIIEKTPTPLKPFTSFVGGGVTGVVKYPKRTVLNIALGGATGYGLGSIGKLGIGGKVASKGLGYGLGGLYLYETVPRIQVGGFKKAGEITTTELIPFGIGGGLATMGERYPKIARESKIKIPKVEKQTKVVRRQPDYQGLLSEEAKAYQKLESSMEKGLKKEIEPSKIQLQALERFKTKQNEELRILEQEELIRKAKKLRERKERVRLIPELKEPKLPKIVETAIKRVREQELLDQAKILRRRKERVRLIPELKEPELPNVVKKALKDIRMGEIKTKLPKLEKVSKPRYENIIDIAEEGVLKKIRELKKPFPELVRKAKSKSTTDIGFKKSFDSYFDKLKKESGDVNRLFENLAKKGFIKGEFAKDVLKKTKFFDDVKPKIKKIKKKKKFYVFKPTEPEIPKGAVVKEIDGQLLIQKVKLKQKPLQKQLQKQIQLQKQKNLFLKEQLQLQKQIPKSQKLIPIYLGKIKQKQTPAVAISESFRDIQTQRESQKQIQRQINKILQTQKITQDTFMDSFRDTLTELEEIIIEEPTRKILPFEPKRKKGKKKKGLLKDEIYAFLPSFTAKALGLEPFKVTQAEAERLVRKELTGFEVRKGARLK